MKLTRRELAAVVSATAVARARTEQPAAAPADDLQTARERLKANGELLAQQQCPWPRNRPSGSRSEARMATIAQRRFFRYHSGAEWAAEVQGIQGRGPGRGFAQRLTQLGPRYNALALPLAQEAIRKAQAVDQDFKAGRLRGPLQGIPYGVKDLLSYKGQPTTWGARPYAGQVFDFNATVIDKLDAVGAVLTGKLAMVELAGGGGYRLASASLTGPGLNPWDRTRWSGGSSQRVGGGRGGGAGDVRHRVGDLGLDRHAGLVLRRNRAAAHLRAGEPAWRHGTFLDAG